MMMTLIINTGVTAIRLRIFMLLLLHKNSIHFIHTLLHYMFIEVLKSMYGCIILRLLSSNRTISLIVSSKFRLHVG